jgi:hypothetical protein
VKIIDPYRFAAGSAYSYDKSLLLNDGAKVNEHLTMGNVLDEDGSNSFTYFFHFKFQTTGGANIQWIFNKYATVGHYCYVDGGGRINFFLRNGTSRCSRQGAVLSINTWYRITVTYDGSKTRAGMKIYTDEVDGSTGGLDTLGTASTATTTTVKLGQNSGTAYDFEGNFFALAKFSVELTPTEVTEITTLTDYDLDGHSQAANLVAYLRFGNTDGDDATGTSGVIQDTIGSFDATPINTVAGDIVTDAP